MLEFYLTFILQSLTQIFRTLFIKLHRHDAWWSPTIIDESTPVDSDGLTKRGKLCNAIIYNVIWTYQKTEYIVYCWLRAHAVFYITCFPAVFKGSNGTKINIFVLNTYHNLYTYTEKHFLKHKYLRMDKG